MGEDVTEIFSSIQGEGKYLGCRQIFLRLAGCNLSCMYCDAASQASPFCRVEHESGSHEFELMKNPLSTDEVLSVIRELNKRTVHQALSLTGGEPLLHTEFIGAIAPGLREQNLPLLLETNGTLPDRLAQVMDEVAIVSMDIKLPSMTGKDYWEEHRRFISLAKDKDLYVKIIVTQETGEEEFRQAVEIAAIAPESMLVLQPVTPTGNVRPISPQRILALQSYAARHHADVRVMPQAHKMMGQL